MTTDSKKYWSMDDEKTFINRLGKKHELPRLELLYKYRDVCEEVRQRWNVRAQKSRVLDYLAQVIDKEELKQQQRREKDGTCTPCLSASKV